MNEREEKHIDILLSEGREIGGHAIKPLSPARVAILERRGNKLVGSASEQSDLDAAAEVFFVVTREPAQLVSMRRMSAEDWLDEVEAFALELGADDLNTFMVYLQGELEAIGAVSAEPVEKEEETTEAPAGTGSPVVSDGGSPTDSRNMAPFGVSPMPS